MADAHATVSKTSQTIMNELISDLPPKQRLHDANPELCDLLTGCSSLDEARDAFYGYLDRSVRRIYELDCDLHPMEKVTLRACAYSLKSVLGPAQESKTGTSALRGVWKIVADDVEAPEVAPAFLCEMVALLKGVAGDAGVYRQDQPIMTDEVPKFLRLKGRQAARKRTEALDELAAEAESYMSRYPSGLEPEVRQRRDENRRRILSYFEANEEDWNDYRWHLDNVITDAGTLIDLIALDDDYRRALEKAGDHGIPFGITPYYVSLMDFEPQGSSDHAVRAQVLPPPEYVDAMALHDDERGEHFDFMGEADTSPINLITRRYPNICILKPYNTCPQICVYCQRNWEIDQCMDPHAKATDGAIMRAIEWIGQHPEIQEVLITGGDPAVLDDSEVEEILEALCVMPQIRRIRFGTRTPVTLPFRWTDSFSDTLAKYHEPGVREVVVVTHFEHPYEITPDARDAVQRIRRRGMSVYNQQVFTRENSRRFESCRLRRDLRIIGVDPYYLFNTKGKKETAAYRVPIARLLQERKEEARILPGVDRTEEPVFNVPRLGKHHLRASGDRELIMIRPENGARVYEFQAWEKNITAMPPYYYDDVPILDYLTDLHGRGEDLEDYRTIWYYF